ncbi:hypothetical protein FACS189427_04370 [Planctomycetales bacterium]|nr:hypothetical protein FACS189427_04370 [Planctomycetales bacterium]
MSPKETVRNEAANSSAERGELPNVVRIISYDNSGQSLGSGSYIGSYDNYGLILSNWHIINDADGLIHVHFPNGFSSYGYVVLSDEKWDLALILISRPPSVSPLPIARHIPEIGETLWIAGFGSGDYRIAKGNCVRYMAPEIPKDGSAPMYEILDLSVSARQGDSGGPILNKHGELAGVLFGSDMVRNTAGSHCVRVSKFLTPMNDKVQKMPLRPEILFAAIEPNGPRHSLYESKNSGSSKTLTAETPRRNSILDNTGSGFGVRSPSRRYTQPSPASPSASYAEPYSPPAVPTETPQQNSKPENPQTNSTATEVHPAVWNQPVKPLKESVNNLPIVKENNRIIQTNHGISKSNSTAKLNALISSPFDNDLSALNPSRNGGSSNLELESKLPKLNGTYQTASYGEAYSSPMLAAMTELTEMQVRRIGQSVPLTPASFNNAVPPLVRGGFFGIATLLVFTAIRLLRYDNVRFGMNYRK